MDSFEFTKSLILERFPQAIIIGNAIPRMTGIFEVKLDQISGKPKIIHSNLNGDGDIDFNNYQHFMKKLEKALKK